MKIIQRSAICVRMGAYVCEYRIKAASYTGLHHKPFFVASNTALVMGVHIFELSVLFTISRYYLHLLKILHCAKWRK